MKRFPKETTMGNRIMRTVLFAASALLSMSAFGAGAARFGTLRNSDWVVTNAWQAVSNRTHDLILEIGQGDSLPPDWQNVSNAAMNAVQSLQPATNYTDEVALDFEEGRRTANFADNSTFSQIATSLGDIDVAYTAQDLINESTNAAVAVADTKISTNNYAFVSAVLAAPLVGADPSDLSEIAEYGTYGTVGAALLALIAGLAALKRGKLDGAASYPAWVQDDYQPPAIVSHKGRLWRCQNYTISEPGEGQQSDWLEVTIEDLKQDALSPEQMDAVNSGATAEKVATWDGYAAQIAAKANAADLPYALVTPGEWEFSGLDGDEIGTSMSYREGEGWNLYLSYEGGESDSAGPVSGADSDLVVEFTERHITATRASLPGHLCDRAVNVVSVSAATTLTLPALVNAGKARDFLVRLTISGSTVPTITFAAPTGETITYETDGDEFPVPDAEGTWLYSFTETAAHTFAVALKKVNEVAAPQTQGGS